MNVCDLCARTAVTGVVGESGEFWLCAQHASDQIRHLRAELDRLRPLAARFGRMQEAARAFSELNAVYRTQGRPSERLFKRLEAARITMQELGAAGLSVEPEATT